MFIDLVNAGIGRPHFNNLGAYSGNKTPVAGSPAGRKLGADARYFMNGPLNSFYQGPRWCKKRYGLILNPNFLEMIYLLK